MMGGRPTLQYGDLGPDVLEAKRLLADAGYSDFLLDEDFSRAMHMAVVAFKMDRGLPGDGIIDADTWSALEQEKSSATRGTRPAGEALVDEEERSRRRGHTIEGLGRLMFVASAAVVGARIVLDRGIVVPISPWEWTAFGFVAVVAIIAIALMTIGGAMVREGRTRRVAAEPLADLGTHLAVGEEIGAALARGIASKLFSLVQGKRYRGTITLSGLQSWAGNETVADKFRELGFADVKVTGSGGSRIGEGKWDKPDQAVPMPEQISDVVEVA